MHSLPVREAMTLDENSTNMVDLYFNESCTDLAEHLTLYKLGYGLQLYYLPIVCLLGWIGNTISLVVLLQPHNRRLSCCLYLASLAVNDNCIVYIAVHYWFTLSLRVGNWRALQCHWIAYFFHVSTNTFQCQVWSVTLVNQCHYREKV